MPSTYTTNGGIELPANGEQASTWGTTVNDNMQIIDRLTNGIGAITLSGTAHTLTTSNGNLSDGQYSVLVLGGSPSGTNTVTVDPNDAQHLYIVKNASGQTATFTQGSGANVSVLNGTTKIIYCDGGGTGAVVVDLTGSIDLGALIVGGIAVTATGTELNILDGVTSTTAELNILDGVTAETAELNILDGVTATTADLNILDGVTSTTAELNILDGVTASTAELNLLDGATATTVELNYVAGVTSAIQTQLDGKEAVDAEILKADTDDNLTAGYTATPTSDGTQASGTYTPTPAGGNFKTAVNGGAFTLAAPTATGSYTLIIQVTNDASAGAVTFSGFSKTVGTSLLTTTDGDDFFIYITKVGDFTSASVEALQ